MLRSFCGPRRRQILPPSTPRRSQVKECHRFWGAHNLSAGSVDRDLRPLWELLGALLTAPCCLSSLFPCSQVLRALFSSLESLFEANLSSPDDPLTLKNIDFSLDVRRILKNQRFRSDLRSQSVLGLSWAHFRCSWGLLGSLLAGLGGSLGAPGGSRKL